MRDPITTEIIRNGLNAAAAEMSHTLVRTAYNPLLYEVQDFGTGIVSARGELWAEGAGGVPPFLGALPDTVRGGLERWGEEGLADGDILIANDPFLSGTHLSDVTICAPIIVDGTLIAVAAATAHWADLGGKTPGGWCPDSTDVYQEGLCFQHQKLVDAGEPVSALWELIACNVRFPTVVRGDLEAQIAACRQGVIRTKALCERYGDDVVRAAMDDVIERTDAAVRDVVRTLPDGRYSARIAMDSDGVTPGARPAVGITIEIKGDRILVSFEGSSQVASGPLNLPAIGTRAHIAAALKGLIMPLDAANHGHFRSIEFSLPPGLIVSPERPAPTDCYGYVGVVLIFLTMKALADAVPDLCPAGGYQLFSVYFHRVDPRDGEPFNFIDILAGGDGARMDGDGPTLIFAGAGDESNTPVEVLETRFPLRCERYELVPEVAGAGRYVGGFGVRRDYRVLEPGLYIQVSVENAADTTARGVAGGSDGRPSSVVVWPGTDRETRITEKTSFFGPLSVGDVVSATSGGGGGWGPPGERDPELIEEDLKNGFLPEERAAEIYGVSAR